METGPRQQTLTHVGLFYRKGNAGDIVMREAVKRFLGSDRAYYEINVRTEVDQSVVEKINQTDAAIVGGGGLLWNNPRLNFPSGWQWNVSDVAIGQIEPPIVLFSVGNSSFYGESIDTPMFRRSMSSLEAQGALFGFRNYGSFRSVCPIMGRRGRTGSFFQPCPTMFLDSYWGVPSPPPPSDRRQRLRVAVNLPLDRKDARYAPGAFEQLLLTIAWMCEEFEVDVAAHIEQDAELSVALERLGASHQLVRLHGATPDAIVEYYRTVDFSVGGRGHALMIPFGIGVPVLGLVSHAKIRWLAESSQGAIPTVNVTEESRVARELRAAVTRLAERRLEAAAHTRAVSERLYDLSARNREVILNLRGRPRRRDRRHLTPIAVGPVPRVDLYQG